MRLHVEIVRSDNPKRQSHTFAASPVRVGRSPLNNLVLSAGWVSQHHGVISFEEGSVTFLDLGSTNGTVVVVDGKERRIAASEPCQLVEPGGRLSTVRIGPIELRFERRPDEKAADASDRALGRRDLSTRLTAGEVKAFRQEMSRRPAATPVGVPESALRGPPAGGTPAGAASSAYKAGGTRMVDSEEGRKVMKEVDALLREREREPSAPVILPPIILPPPPIPSVPANGPGLVSAGLPVLPPLPPFPGGPAEAALPGEPPLALPPWPPLGGEVPDFGAMPFDPNAAPPAFPDLAELEPGAWPDLPGLDLPHLPSAQPGPSDPPVPPLPANPVSFTPAPISEPIPIMSEPLPARAPTPSPARVMPPPPPPPRGSHAASSSSPSPASVSGTAGVIETPHRPPSLISGVLGRVMEAWKNAPGGAPRFDGPERAFVEMLAAVADAFAQGLIEYKKGLRELGDSLGVRAVGSHTPLHRAQSAGELLSYLLDPGADTHERLEQLVDLFADFMIHEVALLNGVKQGLGKLVNELDPEKGYRQNEGRGLALLDRSLKKYATYFEGRTEDGGQRLVFGDAFGRAYADSMGTAQGHGKVPPGHDKKPR